MVVIDDSPEWLNRLGALVKDVPRLFVAGTGTTVSAAIDLVSRLSPPIMILDLSLPDGNGVEVLKHLSSLEAETRVVVMTATPTARKMATCIQLGARYFFDKAFDLAEFQSALQTLLDEIDGEGENDRRAAPIET